LPPAVSEPPGCGVSFHVRPAWSRSGRATGTRPSRCRHRLATSTGRTRWKRPPAGPAAAGSGAPLGWGTEPDALAALATATLLPTVVAGERSDRHGPAPVFVTAIALFVAGLTIGGLAPSMPVLVLGRALQGLGAGAIPAVIYASVGRTYPEALRPRLFAVT